MKRSAARVARRLVHTEAEMAKKGIVSEKNDKARVSETGTAIFEQDREAPISSTASEGCCQATVDKSKHRR